MTNQLACVWTMAAAIGVVACDTGDRHEDAAATEPRKQKPSRRW